jgi:hypothetical protein
MDYPERDGAPFRLESGAQFEGFALISLGIYALFVRDDFAFAHDVRRDDWLPRLHFECIPMALTWHAVPLAKHRAVRGIFEHTGSSAGYLLEALTCV